MMEGIRKVIASFRRPQVFVLGLTLALFGGYLLKPAHAAEILVIPAQKQVLSQQQEFKPVDCAVQACLALTFDDGPDKDYTPRILDTLKNHQAQATFFIMGRHVPGNEALLRRMHAEGHEIGNHSWDHPHFTRISPQQISDQINSTQEVIVRTGVPAPRLLRPPYGDVNEAVLSQIPLTVVRWDIDPEDWSPSHRDQIFEHMQTFARPGGVVVLHDTESTTADHLDQLLTQLEASHYTLVPVSTLLDITPGQAGQYFGR